MPRRGFPVHLPHLADASAWVDRADAAVDALLASMARRDAEFVLVVPPFASPDRPSLGAALVAGAARRAGLTAEVLYANLAFGSAVGLGAYRLLCHTPTEHLFGERVFTAAAPEPGALADLAPLGPLRGFAACWTRSLAARLADLPCRYIGLSSTFEQTQPCLALARHLRRLAPGKRLLLGGANADGPMGPALAELAPDIDVIFSGEAEAAVEQYFRGALAPARVVVCAPNEALEDVPPPDYDDFFRQHRALSASGADADAAAAAAALAIPYESSRGCWWGAKHHCTFCGLNALGMAHRAKSAEKVIREVAALAERHGVTRVVMVDNIMPAAYFATLLPMLRAADRGLELFYEQKANIDRRRMRLLRESGVANIQPGIEALSTALLRLMRKGTTARLNVDCLRHARAEGIGVAWNLLCDFPGDAAESYDETARLIARISHLQPPSGLSGLSVDRFSPYFDDPDAFGIEDVRPLPAYRAVYPDLPAPRVAALAYHFTGRYASAARDTPESLARLQRATDAWRAAWADPGQPVPEFRLFALSGGRTLLVDTRPGAAVDAALLGADEAQLLAFGARASSPAVEGALARGYLAELDGQFAPLAVVDAELLARWDRTAAG